MIIGVGIDIVEVRRIGSLLQKFGEHFLSKIYTEDEISFCQSRQELIGSLAKMFALKEAALKAISNTKEIHWHDIEIKHDEVGKPEVILSGNALRNIMQRAKTFSIQASASDEKQYAIAFVVIQDDTIY